MHVEVEILASPEEVRAVVLDFPRYHEWHNAFIAKIEAPPGSIALGGKIFVTFVDVRETIHATITCNTANEFRFHGSSAAGAFTGQHYFKFNPRRYKVPEDGEERPESNPPALSTIFALGEEQTGWMCFWLEDQMPMEHAQRQQRFGAFARDLKARVESLKRGR
ncbi:hypothetical protein BU24DRAFT_414907 [Aaosphaeria arxii CBS 175.79]|uniref:SRPBCC domain-containing protein n=1 Tax=Aaosphaeria arxii CBS 175.79 TaxID=1450172 RepID=A0A6A5X9L2_9PLEO|nr:uncharacterized protein BU24DRAFT_414907 [Aaosphaeria arxii CBS 175.79]KAF2009599.1 hypothetical protein BU24DRAFT_414907 [Aaosphaeria arxii CBS 175.79]